MDGLAGTPVEEITPPPDFPSLLRELAACIRGEKQPDYTLAHDLIVQETLLSGCGVKDGRALVAAPAGS